MQMARHRIHTPYSEGLVWAEGYLPDTVEEFDRTPAAITGITTRGLSLSLCYRNGPRNHWVLLSFRPVLILPSTHLFGRGYNLYLE